MVNKSGFIYYVYTSNSMLYCNKKLPIEGTYNKNLTLHFLTVLIGILCQKYLIKYTKTAQKA